MGLGTETIWPLHKNVRGLLFITQLSFNFVLLIFINDMKSFSENRIIIRNFVSVLKNRTQSVNIELFIGYLVVLHNALLLEEKYSVLFENSGKEINRFLDFPNSNSLCAVLAVCLTYFDNNHAVRFAIETMDSIEEVRLEMNKLMPVNENFWESI